jgi:hypothetical protein
LKFTSPARWRRRQPSAAEKPLRDELLSIERLEERALALAASLTIDPNPRHRPMDTSPRFEDNVRVLRAAYRARWPTMCAPASLSCRRRNGSSTTSI